MIDNNEVAVTGKFKPKRKFINFIVGLKSNFRLLSNIGYVNGGDLSGMLEGSKFKITIYDDTIDFEEVDTNISNHNMIQRLIDDIDSMDVTGYTNKFILHGLKFESEKGEAMYLEVETEKPINRLFSIFDNSKSKLSDGGMSIIDSLFSSETEEELAREFEGETDEEIENEIKSKNVESKEELPKEEDKSSIRSMMINSFNEMNNEKIYEIKSRINNIEGEIVKTNFDINSSNKKLESLKSELKLLNTRANSFVPNDEPIGFDFFISEEIKTGIEPDENLLKVVEKIAPYLKLNTNALVSILTEGYYKINIKQNKDLDSPLIKEAVKKISTIDLTGKIVSISPYEYEYRGELDWHKLTEKMIRLGFEQNPEFDKEFAPKEDGLSIVEEKVETEEKKIKN